VLPDLGADVLTAGKHILLQLDEHKEKLLQSEFTPHTANGQRMHPVGKMRVCFQLVAVEYKEDFIYLKILPPCYPLPPVLLAPSVQATTTSDPLPTLDDL